MIKIKYKLLFGIEVDHPFYRSGKCPDFLVVPTQSCKAILNSFGLRYLHTEFGGQVYAKVNTDGNNENIKSPIREGSRFSFSMVLRNSNFQNFSEINASLQRPKHYYFNNLTSNLSPESDPLLVANSSLKVVSDTDLLLFVGSNFSYTHQNTATVQNSSVKFLDSGEEFNQVVNNHNNLFNFSYNLKKSSGGRAKFFVEEVEKYQFYAQPTNEFPESFGIIEIFYKNSLAPEYQFQKNDFSLDSKYYKIVFAAKATRWRYIINKKFNKTLSAVNVGKISGQPIQFTALPNPPSDQFIMASNQPIPLREEPVTGIQLRDQAEKVLIAHLPNPPLVMVKTEGSDTFSDILITI